MVGSQSGDAGQGDIAGVHGGDRGDDGVTGVGQAANMTGSASSQLMGLSGGLSAQANELREAVDTFMKDLAAA